MRRVTPYRTFSGAARAFDNGGRFFNLFTKEGDDVVSGAELGKAAGTLDDKLAMLFFAMTTADLSTADQSELVKRFDAPLRARYRKRGAQILAPEAVETSGTKDRPAIVEGEARLAGEEQRQTGYILIPIMIGQVMTMMPMPMADMFTVYELSDGGASCTLAVKKSAKLEPRGRVRWGGILKAVRKKKNAENPKRLILEATLYTQL